MDGDNDDDDDILGRNTKTKSDWSARDTQLS